MQESKAVSFSYQYHENESAISNVSGSNAVPTDKEFVSS